MVRSIFFLTLGTRSLVESSTPKLDGSILNVLAQYTEPNTRMNLSPKSSHSINATEHTHPRKTQVRRLLYSTKAQRVSNKYYHRSNKDDICEEHHPLLNRGSSQLQASIMLIIK